MIKKLYSYDKIMIKKLIYLFKYLYIDSLFIFFNEYFFYYLFLFKKIA